jgi:hypothetical protein
MSDVGHNATLSISFPRFAPPLEADIASGAALRLPRAPQADGLTGRERYVHDRAFIPFGLR